MPTDLSEVIAASIAIINHQLALKEVEVIQDLDADLPIIQGNANQLQQVLMNLMINAQQAMGGKAGEVRVSAHRDEDQIEIRVSDNGPGIPAEIQQRLFEPFFTTKPAGEGTGLGLSVSFGIVKDHSGEISVDSEVGRGTDFIIRIPIPTEEGPVTIS